MKVYHGRWDDSQVEEKEFIAEYKTKEELLNVINDYVSKYYYIQWTDDIAEHNCVIADYGSWSDFIFITGVNSIKELF